MLKQFWDSVPSWLKNRYVLTAFAFVFWLLIFDQNDLITQYKLQSDLQELEDRREYFEEEIEKAQSSLEELLGNDAELEKFAREKYLMKKDDEVIFVFVEEAEE